MTENLLRHETSPYLLQHRDNPVHWRPWGKAAFEEARRLDRPVLLSIGYAACHWCHVMAHESFEDPEIAALMNRLFVNVKVDREERPDIDQIYMAALHALGDRGGWPLTMFLTPDGKPIWGGTYFPDKPRYGRPGFPQILAEISRVYHDEPDKVLATSEALYSRLAEAPASGGPALTGRLVDLVADQIFGHLDPVEGGFVGAPKFPQPVVLEFLARATARTGDRRYASAALLALTKMSEGGIYDHIGGGYARYSTDEVWLVPHFEKMLYDNALLIEALARAYRETGNALFATRIEETIDWLKAEMLTTEGAFSASLDADSEGEEGRFYVWRRSEIESILGPDADLFCEVYDITTGGNWAGVSIPNRSRFGRALDADETARLAAARKTLAAARAARPRPGLDDKILADWNGFAIAAITDAATLFDRTDWLELATAAYRFVTESMTRDGRLGHAWRAGKLTFPGLSSDLAGMARAAAILFEATAEPRYLADAEHFIAVLDDHHRTEAGGYHLAADDADDLVLRIRTAADDAVPNPNAVAAETMVRLWLLTGKESYRDGADSIFEGFAADIARNPAASFGLLNAFDFRLDPTIVVIVGPPTDRAVLRRAYLETPGLSAVLFETESVDDLPVDHPAHGKTTGELASAAFVCRGGTCSLPVGEPAALAELMRQR